MKTNKSYTKRLKITKNGKLKARKPGQNHFNAKESSSVKLSKGRQANFVISQRDRRRFITTASAK